MTYIVDLDSYELHLQDEKSLTSIMFMLPTRIALEQVAWCLWWQPPPPNLFFTSAILYGSRLGIHFFKLGPHHYYEGKEGLVNT